jgi:hypothetical protein
MPMWLAQGDLRKARLPHFGSVVYFIHVYTVYKEPLVHIYIYMHVYIYIYVYIYVGIFHIYIYSWEYEPFTNWDAPS